MPKSAAPSAFVHALRHPLLTVRKIFEVTDERRNQVRRDILHGSTPSVFYYLLLIISSLIVSFGLLLDSPAVVIGAMLVSPLMTPIFGMSMGLVRGNTPLLKRAFFSEFGGVVFIVAFSALIGFLPLYIDITPEMISRTKPTLIDLLVAILAGLAGCMAMIDERISPVLPGIAMATALTPPLATCGMCLTMGYYAGAWGAFLLFFANFLGILVVSAILFIVAGFVSHLEIGTKTELVRRFSWAVLFFLLVTAILSNALISFVEKKHTEKIVKELLHKGLEDHPSTNIRAVYHKHNDDKIEILAFVRTPREINPTIIRQIQEAIHSKLKKKVSLLLRCEISRDVSAKGTVSNIDLTTPDGDFTTDVVDPEVRLLQIAEQTLRELLEGKRDTTLKTVNIMFLPDSVVLMAVIQGEPLSVGDIHLYENTLNKAIDIYDITLVVRSNPCLTMSKDGKILLPISHRLTEDKDTRRTKKTLEEVTKKSLNELTYIVSLNVNAARRVGKWAIKKNKSKQATNVLGQVYDKDPKRDEGWLVKAEVVGERVVAPNDVRAITDKLKKITGTDVELLVLSKVGAMVTSKGLDDPENFWRTSQ